MLNLLRSFITGIDSATLNAYAEIIRHSPKAEQS